MREKNKNQDDLEYAPAVTAGAGVVAGATTTSGAAISVAGTGGISGYVLGTGALIANIGCEAAAIAGLAAVAVGPILGGLIGYGVYRGVKKIVKDK